MAAKSAALAKEFETKVEAAIATLEKLSQGDWMKVTEAERWSVGVTAHHFAGAFEPIAHMVEAVVAGQVPGGGTVLTDASPMTAEELIRAGLLAHIDEHFGSIRKTIGY